MNYKNIFFVLFFWINAVFACTGVGFTYKGRSLAGKNHDWIKKQAAIVINPRGMTNHSNNFHRKDELLNWSSKYGSISVNPAEKGDIIPSVMAGMNEKGLCVLTLCLGNASYPAQPKKPVVPTELLAKYFLDNAATVSEAIALAQKIDAEPATFPDDDASQLAKILGIDRAQIGDINLHFFLQDEKGEAAVFDYLDEKLVIHTGNSLPILALSNDSYGDSINYLTRLKPFGGEGELPGDFDSLSRFAKAAYGLKVMPDAESVQDAVSHAFIALAYAQSPRPATQWTVVFDLLDKVMYLRSVDNQQLRIVRLNAFDISEGAPCLFFSINTDSSGYVKDAKEPNGSQD